MENRAWLLHQNKWLQIESPLNWQNSPNSWGERQRDRFFASQGYAYDKRTLGPARLFSQYSGMVLYIYAAKLAEVRHKPEYLIWMEINGLGEELYAQDLPDLLVILALLTPIVTSDILAYAFVHSQQRMHQERYR
jgi:hypothetical protein